MSQSLPELRWAENEVIFRQSNEKVAKDLATTKAIAAEEGQQASVRDIDDVTLLFYCECSDEKCRERIALTPKEYTEQHRNRSQFILLPGHHIPQIERIIFEADKYIVVQKYLTPPEHAEKVNSTDS